MLLVQHSPYGIYQQNDSFIHPLLPSSAKWLSLLLKVSVEQENLTKDTNAVTDQTRERTMANWEVTKKINKSVLKLKQCILTKDDLWQRLPRIVDICVDKKTYLKNGHYLKLRMGRLSEVNQHVFLLYAVYKVQI